MRFVQIILQLGNSKVKLRFFLYHTGLFLRKVGFGFTQKDGQVLDLGLQPCDCLNELSLLLKARVPYQLRVVHLDHLQLLGRGKLLLNQSFFFSSVRLLDFIDLFKVTLLVVGSLLCPCLLNLVGELEDFLGMVRLKLLFTDLQVFDLLSELLHFELRLSLRCILLQSTNLLLGLGFLGSHFCM